MADMKIAIWKDSMHRTCKTKINRIAKAKVNHKIVCTFGEFTPNVRSFVQGA